MAKSFEELEAMEVGQLKGILKSLDVAVPVLDYRKSENKTKLVQLAYDVQQADPVEPVGEEKADTSEADAQRAEDSEIDIDAMLDQVADFFGGTIEAVGETEDEVTIFAVVSEDGNEIERGTFLKLKEKVEAVRRQEAENAAAMPDLPRTPEEQAAPSEESLSEIDQRLLPLKRIGLKVEVGQDVVKLRFGSKAVTTTVHQPVHRIVKTAETLVKVR
jgi:hypothetical protein